MQVSADKAIVKFPGVTPQTDVDRFLTDNHLTVVGWQTQPLAENRAGERSVLVSLPPIELQVIDAANGVFGATVPAHLDDNMAAGRGRMPDAAQRRRLQAWIAQA